MLREERVQLGLERRSDNPPRGEGDRRGQNPYALHRATVPLSTIDNVGRSINALTARVPPAPCPPAARGGRRRSSKPHPRARPGGFGFESHRPNNRRVRARSKSGSPPPPL